MCVLGWQARGLAVGVSTARAHSRRACRHPRTTQKFRFLRPGMQVVDLGSAPGGWLQVAAQKVLHTRQLGAGACERVEAARATDGRRASAGGPATLEYGSDSDDAVSFLSLMAGGSGEDDGGTQPSPGVDDSGTGRGKLQRYQVVGVDLLPVAPVPGTLCLQGDFTDPHVQTRLLARMRRPKADAGAMARKHKHHPCVPRACILRSVDAVPIAWLCRSSAE